jgi:hypothetical protein
MPHKSKKKRANEAQCTSGEDTTGQEAKEHWEEGDENAIANQSSAASPQIRKSCNDREKHAGESKDVEHSKNKKRNEKRKNVIGEGTATPDTLKHKSKKRRAKEGKSTAGEDTTGQEAKEHWEEGDENAIANQSSAASPEITKSGKNSEKHSGNEEDGEHPEGKKKKRTILPSRVKEWTVNHVCKWLKRLGKKTYTDKDAYSRKTFKEQKIDGKFGLMAECKVYQIHSRTSFTGMALLELTDEELEKLGVGTIGERKNPLSAMKSLPGKPITS